MFDRVCCPHIGVTLRIEGVSTAGVAVPVVELEEDKGLLNIQPGRITELVGDPGSGLTRLGLRLIAPHSRIAPVVALDTRGWLSPEAAWETGVLVERLVVVRCEDPILWVKVMAALLEGVQAVYAEVPTRVRDGDLRRLAALTRARRVSVAMRSMGAGLPGGMAYLRLRALGVTWEGADRGHGRLTRRRLVLEATGKGSGGMARRFEVEDEGTDALRLVSDVVVDSRSANTAGRSIA
jgi:recA bacterial DNA recombination protein